MSWPAELYTEIVNGLDFPTALHFRISCRTLGKSNTDARQKNFQARSIVQAAIYSKIVLLKSMASVKVPHVDWALTVYAIGLNDVPFYKMLVQEYNINTAKDYKEHLCMAELFDATDIEEYIKINFLNTKQSYSESNYSSSESDSESDYSSSESDSYWEVHSDLDACGTPEYCSDGIWSDTE